MKQLIDTDHDIDIRKTLKRLLPATALGLSIVASSSVMADSMSSENSDSIVTAMYGFQNTKYIEAASYTDDDYASDLAQSVFGKKTGRDYSNESIYVDSLVKSIEGTNQSNSPDFSNDEVYINHLVEIIMK